MQLTRRTFLPFATAAAVAVALTLAGPSFAKGGAGGGAAGGGAAGGGGKAATKAPAKAKTVYEVIEADTSLSKFTEALKAAGLDATLKGSGPFTVLAPNDTAFGKVDATKLAELLKPANKDKLKTILQGHILSSKMTGAEIGKATKLSAMGGVSHEMKPGDDKQPAIDGVAKISKADVAGSNGLIQIIDTVLLPAEKSEKPAEKAPADKAPAPK